MTSPQTYLSIPEAVSRLQGQGLQVSAPQVRRWVRKGQLAAIKLPNGRAQLRPQDVDALLVASR